MNLLHLPWLEFAIVTGIIGSPIVSRLRDPNRAYRWGLLFTGTAFASALLAGAIFAAGIPAELTRRYSAQPFLFGRQIFGLDELSAPLVPTVALLHFLTALATARTHMRRYSIAWSLAAEVIVLAKFSCKEPWILVGLLAASTIPPYLELRNRARSTRVYVMHMTLFVILLVFGWAIVERSTHGSGPPAWWVTLPLLAAILVRCGTVPAHCWLTDWFEHASHGIALLYVVPLSGVYAAVRLLLPVGQDWVLRSIGLLSLVTAVYAAAMATVQRETRRFFAFVFLSLTSLVLVGLELQTELSLTGSFCLWFAVIVSLGGFGLTFRALEARFGRLSLTDYHGLYEHTPTLAVFFLVTGLASVGFPGTLGFIATELLVDSAVEANPYIGIGVIATGALNGIAVVRAYFLLFTGARHASTVSVGIGLRERIAVLTLSGLILGGGIYPQPNIASRQRAAEEILQDRRERSSLEHPFTTKRKIPAPVGDSAAPGRWLEPPRHTTPTIPTVTPDSVGYPLTGRRARDYN